MYFNASFNDKRAFNLTAERRVNQSFLFISILLLYFAMKGTVSLLILNYRKSFVFKIFKIV